MSDDDDDSMFGWGRGSGGSIAMSRKMMGEDDNEGDELASEIDLEYEEDDEDGFDFENGSNDGTRTFNPPISSETFRRVTDWYNYDASEHLEVECSICIQTFLPGNRIVVLNCNHSYHSGCIERWLTNSDSRCPECRNPVGN